MKMIFMCSAQTVPGKQRLKVWEIVPHSTQRLTLDVPCLKFSLLMEDFACKTFFSTMLLFMFWEKRVDFALRKVLSSLSWWGAGYGSQRDGMQVLGASSLHMGEILTISLSTLPPATWWSWATDWGPTPQIRSLRSTSDGGFLCEHISTLLCDGETLHGTSVTLYWTLSSMSRPFFYWGAQNWTQHCRRGLTNAEYSRRIPLLACWQYFTSCSQEYH